MSEHRYRRKHFADIHVNGLIDAYVVSDMIYNLLV